MYIARHIASRRSTPFGRWASRTLRSTRALKALALIGCAIPAFAASEPAFALAIDGGDYVPLPPGTQLALFYQQYASSRGLHFNGKDVNPGAELSTDISLFRYVGYASLFGRTVDYQVIQPMGVVHGGGTTKSLGTAGGLSDTILVGTIWLQNNRAAQSYFGLSPYLYIPTGQYDRHTSLSVGENRWKGALQAVYSKGFGKHFVAEAVGDVTFHGDNSAYNINQTMKQTATYSTQGFVRYLINPKNEVNLRTSYTYGGDEHVDGVDQEDKTKTWAMLGSYVRILPANFQLMLQAGRDINVKNGFDERERFQFRVAKAF